MSYCAFLIYEYMYVRAPVYYFVSCTAVELFLLLQLIEHESYPIQATSADLELSEVSASGGWLVSCFFRSMQIIS